MFLDIVKNKMNLFERINAEPPNPLDEEAKTYIINWIPPIIYAIERQCTKARNTYPHCLNGFMTFDYDADSGYTVSFNTINLDDYFWEHYCRWFHHGDVTQKTYDGYCSNDTLKWTQGIQLFYRSNCGGVGNLSNPNILDRIIIALQNKLIEEGFPKENFKISRIKYTYKWPTERTGFWNPRLTNFVDRTEHTIGLYIKW